MIVLPAMSIDNTATPRQVDVSMGRLQRLTLFVFACLNAASVGVFFVVFVGVVAFPPLPRNATFILVVGSFAFGVLVMGQFVHWTRLALRAVKDRRS